MTQKSERNQLRLLFMLTMMLVMMLGLSKTASCDVEYLDEYGVKQKYTGGFTNINNTTDSLQVG